MNNLYQTSTHRIFVVHGLGDNHSFFVRSVTNVLSSWKKISLDPQLYLMGWHDGTENFQKKLKRLLGEIDRALKKFDRVSLVGLSAGGSAVLNAFAEKKGKIYRVVNICGRLKSGKTRGFRSFEARTNSSPAFRESVLYFEKNEHLLTDEDRKRVMTVTAKYGDELVPADTAVLNGAFNLQVPVAEHMFSIYYALRFFKLLTEFLDGEDLSSN